LGLRALYSSLNEWVIAQILNDLGVVRFGRMNFITLPAAQRNHRNPKPACGFWLEDIKLEAAPAEVAADGGRFFWNLYAAVPGW